MLVAEGLLAVALVQSVPRRNLGDKTVLHFDSSSRKELVLSTGQAVAPALGVADNLKHAMAKDLASVSQVRHIVVDEVDDSMLVWIAVDDPQRTVRERIFQKELDLMDAFPQVKFDFNLVPTMERPLEEFLTQGHRVYSRQD